MAESFADHFAESAARTNALRRSHRELNSERERAARVWRSLETDEPRSPSSHPQTLAILGSLDKTPLLGVTEEDEMNARLASEMDQLERWKTRREATSSRDQTLAAGLSPIVRDALREALLAEKRCARLFNAFHPPCEDDERMDFVVSLDGTPRISNGTGRARYFQRIASRPAFVNLEKVTHA
jgi:hypothetical protein